MTLTAQFTASDRGYECTLRDEHGTQVSTGHGIDRAAALAHAAMNWSEGYQ